MVGWVGWIVNGRVGRVDSKWSGGSGIHPTRNYKSVIRPLSEYLKNLYLYLSIYMLTDKRTNERFGRIGRAGWV
jgi:hypothetical protein